MNSAHPQIPGTSSHVSSMSGNKNDSCRPQSAAGVGVSRLSFNAGLSPADLEARIQYCGEQMEAAMARYEASSDFGDRAEADSWRLSMEDAIRARSAGQIKRMESERGLG